MKKISLLLIFLFATIAEAFQRQQFLKNRKFCLTNVEVYSRQLACRDVSRRKTVQQGDFSLLAKAEDSTVDQQQVLLPDSNDRLALVALSLIGFLYWYWLVFGAAAEANGLPLVPDFLPMKPGWPPSTEDLQGPIDDFSHFFYLGELLGKEDMPYAPPVRLAVFNAAEAWIFAVLPALWKDSRRLPRPILLLSWLTLGINLTNAFLFPYLVTSAFATPSDKPREKNKLVSFTMGGISATVVAFALFQTATMTTTEDWRSFLIECQQDRTYLAFMVDLTLFSLVQPYVLKRAKGSNESIDYVPFLGLFSFLFKND